MNTDLITTLSKLHTIESSDGQDYVQMYDVLETVRRYYAEKTAECFTLAELEEWLWANVLNNYDNEYGKSVETIIGRLDGFKRFVEDSRMKGENQ